MGQDFAFLYSRCSSDKHLSDDGSIDYNRSRFDVMVWTGRMSTILIGHHRVVLIHSHIMRLDSGSFDKLFLVMRPATLLVTYVDK